MSAGSWTRDGPWAASQTLDYERLSGAQRLAILDALIHAAADSEGFRAHVLSTARQQVTN